MAAGLQTRALVRQEVDVAGLETLGVEVARGDLRDRQSLDRAVAGVATIISTANSIGRRFAGERNLSMQAVDDEGYAALIGAAEQAAVGRFVYLSLGGPALLVNSPFSNAKRATEARLRRSPLQEVIVRPDAFQQLWLSPAVGFDPAAGRVMIFGRGLSRVSYVGMDDVAAAVVALAQAADPPRLVELGGPEAITRIEAAEAFATAMGRPIRRRHISRAALRIGSMLLRRAKPELNPFELTHEFFAVMLGASRPSVSLAAEALKRAGLIDYQRDRITILNRTGLEEAACECYAVISDEYERATGARLRPGIADARTGSDADSRSSTEQTAASVGHMIGR